ncbi:TetR/AcrR family transcriptional regulator [Kineothrix sedimenti]|uniref:TetR/AcrR family transcriptional regulator C-terminal domain-containing protein n=1 Tax=Kineothrix sedimenti TaxID=3123317 RepID=A0ABZ3ES42_9FIRM
MNTKNNLRYKESEQKIKDTVMSLLNSKSLNQLTVQDICKNSGINRSTFYAHYQDIPELLNILETDIHKKIIAKYNSIDDVSDSMLDGSFYLPFLTTIYEHRNFYKACLQSRNNFPITTGYEALMEHVVKPVCESAGITNNSEMLYYLVFYQAGFTFVLKRWVDDDCKESPEKISDYLRNCLPRI